MYYTQWRIPEGHSSYNSQPKSPQVQDPVADVALETKDQRGPVQTEFLLGEPNINGLVAKTKALQRSFKNLEQIHASVKRKLLDQQQEAKKKKFSLETGILIMM